tara:strand:- start:369 stop:1217 length:849 start_codon:yes stop_codon:yes gene_type:complete
MHRVAYVNNSFVPMDKAFVSIEDRGLQFSDSVYEVVMVINKNLIDFEHHIKRLEFSLNQLSIKFYINKIIIKNIFQKLIKKNSLKNGILYLQITRGVQPREHAYKKNLKPTFICYTQKKTFNLPNNNFKSYKAVTYPDIRWSRVDIKSTSLLPNILASTYALKNKAYEAIFIKNNKITEAAHSNVWIIKNNTIYTHPAKSRILNGITRLKIIEIIKKNKLKFKEKTFTLKQLYDADEVFITSSGSLITPINKIDNKKINNGKIGILTKKLAVMLISNYKKQK